MYFDPTPPIFTLKVEGKRSPMFIVLVCGFFACLSGLGAISLLVSVASDGKGLKFGVLIGVAALLGFSFYFIRLIVWNRSGLEVIEVGEHEVVYRAQSSIFTLETHKLPTEGCILIRDQEDENGRCSYFLRNAEQVVEMQFAAKRVDLDRLEEALRSANV